MKSFLPFLMHPLNVYKLNNSLIKIFVYLTVIFMQINYAQEGWYEQLGDTKNLNCIQFIDNNIGWTVGDGGTILNSNDGGMTWEQSNGEINGDCNSVFFLNDEMGWMTEYGWILSTVDGGNSWAYQYKVDFSPLLFSIFFTDSDHGWVIGMYSYIMRTVDGGNTWTEEQSGSNTNFTSVFFVDSTTGWIVGNDFSADEGMILHTIDGGINWTSQISGCNLTLNSVYFINREIGWVFGGPDTLLKTTNGGEDWNKNEIGLGWSYFNSACFIDENIGWAVGDFGNVIHTLDGGENWSYQESGITNRLNSVCFIDENNGWIAGGSLSEPNSGIILKTTNGGLTYIEEEGQETIPIDFALLQNYPNPFNSTTNISYTLSRKSNVLITIYDLMGKIINVAASGIRKEGEHNIVWENDNLASGIYFYRFEATTVEEQNTFVSTKKMILLK
jgi:photosystem II stability/assembly factor-like uncharacterized protein